MNLLFHSNKNGLVAVATAIAIVTVTVIATVTYGNNKISDISFTSGEENSTDARTEHKNNIALNYLIKNGTIGSKKFTKLEN